MSRNFNTGPMTLATNIECDTPVARADADPDPHAVCSAAGRQEPWPASPVIDLASRRRDPASASDVVACRCGGEWFTLDGRAAGLDQDAGVVALRSNGGIRAYSGVPRCANCGALVSDSAM